MPFPITERVIYRKNPLRQVICQLKYPAILKIDVGMPADFQEIIRKDFPIFQENNEIANLQLPEKFKHAIPQEMLGMLGSGGNRQFQFKTQDESWVISLTKDFIALETSDYSNWEEYRGFLELALNALVDIYAPSFLTRIGLRYRNVIDRDELGLSDYSWHELLADFILGGLALPEIRDEILEHKGSTVVQLENNLGLAHIQHGFVQDKSETPSNIMYLLDNDFYTTEETEVNNVIDKLENFNTTNRRLFRWCIKERLHGALEPKSI
jgi:uncharacterized protein (TIGR04255 family)